MVIYSLFLELNSISKLEDMAKIKVGYRLHRVPLQNIYIVDLLNKGILQ